MRSFPVLGVDPKCGARPSGQIDEAAVIADFAIAKQPGQQGHGVLCEGRVDKWFLPLKGLDCATAWFSVIVESLIANLREKLRDCTQT